MHRYYIVNVLAACAAQLRRIAAKLGFHKARQTGSHERWLHEDGRSTTIPTHGGREIGPPLLYQILKQLGIDLDRFETMR
jgi:predicted RNA binding protein YcfA (HicA-like mRNA interferase family)